MLLKNNLGFSIWIYVFGFSRCNGLIIRLPCFMQLHIRHTYEMPAFETFPSFAYNPVRILPKDNLSTSLKIWQTML